MLLRGVPEDGVDAMRVENITGTHKTTGKLAIGIVGKLKPKAVENRFCNL